MEAEKTFTFTVEQIQCIFNEGVRVGESQYVSHFEAFVDAVFEAVNWGKSVFDEDHVSHDQIREMIRG